MNLPRRLATALLATALLAGCGRREAAPEPVRAVRTQTVTAGVAAATTEYAGEIRARQETRLGFRVGGKITRRAAELGQQVRAGQVLAQLDPDDMRQGWEAARAAVAAAEANVELVSAEHRRFKELREQGFISAAELDRRAMAVKSAQAQLDQARAQATVQFNQAGYTALVAPAAGVVTAVEAEVGTVVAAGQSVLRLALDGPRDAAFAVPENALAGLKAMIGRPGLLRVRVWGSESVVPATLRELAASADPMTRTFLAKADVADAAVTLGQTTTVLVDLPRLPGIVRLPLSALVRQQDKTAVYVVDEASMTLRQVPVAIGGADGNEVVISSGLTPGQQVVVAGVHVLSPGQKVKFYSATATSAPAPAAAASAAR